LFLDDYVTISFQWISEMKKTSISIRKVIGYCGPSLNDLEVYRAYIVILSCLPEDIGHLTTEGFNSIQLHHCFESRLLSRLSSAQGRQEYSPLGQGQLPAVWGQPGPVTDGGSGLQPTAYDPAVLCLGRRS
jgi:hypothetical protein